MDYLYSVDEDLNDCGGFYFGLTDAFRQHRSLDNAIKFVLWDGRALDINTPSDWKEAEKRFTSLRRQHEDNTILVR